MLGCAACRAGFNLPFQPRDEPNGRLKPALRNFQECRVHPIGRGPSEQWPLSSNLSLPILRPVSIADARHLDLRSRHGSPALPQWLEDRDRTRRVGLLLHVLLTLDCPRSDPLRLRSIASWRRRPRSTRPRTPSCSTRAGVRSTRRCPTACAPRPRRAQSRSSTPRRSMRCAPVCGRWRACWLSAD